jgi:hypothetical protein
MTSVLQMVIGVGEKPIPSAVDRQGASADAFDDLHNDTTAKRSCLAESRSTHSAPAPCISAFACG